MAYIPPSFDNIVIGSDEPPPYVVPDYNNIIIGDVVGIGRYAIVMYENHMVMLSNTLLGLGLPPVVWHEGKPKPRKVDEGIPIVMINGKLTTLPEEDYLII